MFVAFARNKHGRIRRRNQEKLATLGTQDTRRRQTKQNTQHIMCLTPLYTWHKTKTNEKMEGTHFIHMHV